MRQQDAARAKAEADAAAMLGPTRRPGVALERGAESDLRRFPALLRSHEQGGASQAHVLSAWQEPWQLPQLPPTHKS